MEDKDKAVQELIRELVLAPTWAHKVFAAQKFVNRARTVRAFGPK